MTSSNEVDIVIEDRALATGFGSLRKPPPAARKDRLSIGKSRDS
ncbi:MULTISPECIES: hypothetical protein [unclassified Rhizobium]|nr:MULTISPECIES: hypothetical protein [unclassified Rhizobium]MCS3743321.1 hypothetical protein [Rhizobium sp. BK661]MCS4096471.1 hypothetical protein [Rhizobium sp. BK176]